MLLKPLFGGFLIKLKRNDDIRLERARELLEENSHDSIQEIAAQVGYDDAYHFSKLFKKKYGCSPSKIRKA